MVTDGNGCPATVQGADVNGRLTDDGAVCLLHSEAQC